MGNNLKKWVINYLPERKRHRIQKQRKQLVAFMLKNN